LCWQARRPAWARWWPLADIPNHFTPFLFALAAVGLILLPFGELRHLARRSIRSALGLGLAGVAAINAAPLYSSLATTAVAAPGRADTLTVVSFNVWSRNAQLDEAARWLLAQNADVIVLQEMTRLNREPIRRALVPAYPHVHDCGCNDIAMFSRRPWMAAGGQGRTAERPSLSWLTVPDRNGRETRIVGLHPRYNIVPAMYAAHYAWLVRHVPALGERLVLVGDSNAVPWSWQMQRLVAATGLRRHGTYEASWPSYLPVLLIDNLLTTPDIGAVSFRTGPPLGSDHRPVVATVALP
jgi:endonuclease/exonuclease/phosphatase (EEP) superfamily protein YafD